MKKEIKELIRYAIKAPSGHNTQPWKFKLDNHTIRIYPDYKRALPIVDRDNHALWISLGCALENLVIAAGENNFKTNVNIIFNKDAAECIEVSLLESDKKLKDELFNYIEKRQSTRNPYNGKKISEQDITVLNNSFNFSGITAQFFLPDEFHLIEPFIIEGSNKQFGNKAFVNELVDWFRFSKREAEEKADGLWVASMGLPNMGKFIGNIVMKHFVSAKSEAKRWKSLIYSSSGFVLFIADINDVIHWINLGRAFQRFALTATKLNISHSHVNMPCEELEVRMKLAEKLGISKKHPLLLIRFGYSEKMPYSFRRQVNDVII